MSADKQAKSKEATFQKVFVAVTFQPAGEGAQLQAHMEVDYKPAMPMLDKHKVNFGVNGIQASAAALPSMIEHQLGLKGFLVTHPGKDNPKL